MRTKNVLRNTGFSLVLEVITLAFGLVMPRMIILTYGSSVNGLTSMINQIIGVINLLQAGAVGASIFEMYRPVAEKDFQKITSIYVSSKKYFKRLGYVFFIIIIAITPIVVLNHKNSELPSWSIVLSILILGLNAGYNFFFYACYDIIFSANQKNFQISLANIIEKLIYYGLLFCVVRSRVHFVFIYLAVLVGGTSKILYLTFAFNKCYKKKMSPFKKDMNFKVKNKVHLLINQISTQLIESSPVLVVSSVWGLREASVYTVYNLIQHTMRTVFASIQYSIAASFGNVTVSEKQEKVNSVFNVIHFVFSMMGTFLYTCTAFLFMPFIHLYTKNFSDIQYIIPSLALAFILYSVSWCLYMPYAIVSNVYGLFKDISAQSVISAAISLIIAFIGARSGISFVLFGLIFYYSSSFIWRLIVIKKRLPWFSLLKLPKRATLLILSSVSAYGLNRVLGINLDSWFIWVIYALITVFLVAVYLMIYILVFERKEFKMCLLYAKAVVSRKK